MFANVVMGQKIYSVKYESQAQVKVFVVKYESQADLLVYKVAYESQAGQNDGKWFFVDYESRADKKIFFVDYESRADLKIFFVDYESRAGWKNNAKKHLMYWGGRPKVIISSKNKSRPHSNFLETLFKISAQDELGNIIKWSPLFVSVK